MSQFMFNYIMRNVMSGGSQGTVKTQTWMYT